MNEDARCLLRMFKSMVEGKFRMTRFWAHLKNGMWGDISRGQASGSNRWPTLTSKTTLASTESSRATTMGWIWERKVGSCSSGIGWQSGTKKKRLRLVLEPKTRDWEGSCKFGVVRVALDELLTKWRGTHILGQVWPWDRWRTLYQTECDPQPRD